MAQQLHDLTIHLIRLLNIEPEDMDHPEYGRDDEPKNGYGAQVLWEKRGEQVRECCRQMNPGTLGRIAAQGSGDRPTPSTSLYQVHCGTYLGKYDDGLTILIDLAATAVVAEMTDVLRDGRKKRAR